MQIDRSAGEGTGVNVRGLPEVGTLLNGEAFLTTSNIVGIQPNFADVPSQLFAGADVVKAPTATLINSGITGTINLKTRRPLDMPSGLTLSGAAEGIYGTVSSKIQPNINTLAGYNAGRFGALLAVSYSDITLENSVNGIDTSGGGELFSECAGTSDGCTGAYNGFVAGWNGVGIPAAMHYNSTTGTVDVNNNGTSTDAFYGTQNAAAAKRQDERQRIGVNASLQADFGSGFVASADFFYTFLDQHERTVGLQLNSDSWLGATFIPTATRDSGFKVYPGWNQLNALHPEQDEFYVTHAYTKYIGDAESYSGNVATTSSSRNYNMQFAYDNGGNFSAELRGIYADARELMTAQWIQYTLGDGAQWNNGSTTYAGPNGNFVFNSLGIAHNAVPVGVDMSGNNMVVALPSQLSALMANPDAYAFKTLGSGSNYDRNSDMQIVRLDGHYKFNDSGVRLDFGVRQSFRNAENTGFNLVAPVYGGTYARNADGSANATGCYVLWKAADVLMNGSQCYAKNGAGDYIRANAMAGYSFAKMPGIVSNNTKFYSNIAGVDGMSFYALNPKAMDDAMGFENALFPGEMRELIPGQSWAVNLQQTQGYVQGTFDGTIKIPGLGEMPFMFNTGMRVMETWLTSDQHKVDTTGQIKSTDYGQANGDLGITETTKTFTDYLPAVNISVDLQDDLKFRAAYSRNMQLLDLSQWGGAMTLTYGLADATSNIYAVLGGTQSGNPALKPWRSANYDMSLEYYYSKSSMVSVALFYIDVDSFIYNGSTLRCDLPDQDGVLRNRCVSISGPLQGEGKSLKGIEFANKQAFDFMPGIWANFGSEVNFTYSPSNSGNRDISGAVIPFQNNSKFQANLILWYQDDRFEARVAGNYRSKRAVSSDIGGISGFEEYQKPTFYLDASANYDITPNWTAYVQGANILGENEHYYYVWTDQKADTTMFEPRLTVGVRARF